MIDPVNNIRLAGPEAPEEMIPNDPINIVEGARRYSPLSPPLDGRDGPVERVNHEEEFARLVEMFRDRAVNRDGYHDSDNEHDDEEEEHDPDFDYVPAVHENPLLMHRQPRYIPYSPADTPSSSNSPTYSSGSNSPVNAFALLGVVEDVMYRDGTISPGEIVSARELFEREVSDLQFSEKICVDEGSSRKRKNEDEDEEEDMEPSQKKMHFGVMKLFNYRSRRDPPDDPGAGPSGTQFSGTNNNNINNQNFNML